MAIEMIDNFDMGTQIKVIGVGGGGGNAVEHMISESVQGVQFICANTDSQALNRSSAEVLLQLGNSGLGAGAKPEAGKAAAEEAVDQIRNALDGSHMVFITAGMGGGTGTGAAPVIARVAKEMGILTVGVVTKPFDFEGNRRLKQADAGLAELEANVDSLIVVLNEKLLEVMGDDVTQEEAFGKANDVLKNAVGGISDIIHIPGLVNVDFEDVKTVMSEPGKAMMGTATAGGPDRATKAAEAAVACPLLEGIDLSGARGVLVLIAASKATFKLSESRNAMNTIRRYAAEDAHVIYGTAYDESLGDQLRVTVIATGLCSAKRAAAPMTVVHSALRTGTDNIPVLTDPVAPHPSGLGMGRATAGGDFSGLNTPSVWRSGRTQAAAKVDALASNGMDEIEIPAFLRRQAD
ncbi:MAG: cell division protein FtsZ [Burkholderiales bacterium RIFCSPLOWO2_12_FULL_64_99]|jgi:cell division protein FtsZ|uniref:cell division protein FtsZ n=1 Tax=Aquabacterium sp. TaxID=1872578 RepID=UPI0008ABD8E8|nr:cell division protein FtsZ [Aquabacterium sp.]OGB03328.1 MAG: cell division protein FtsZ [Burkholderiales bacterium RIFCSPHIGHO2_12_FULL_63_20]OGB67203.1 MAG: cell division protein FtsZ [Burkholderiales bacterium RIFCSPLOWO2_12_FULL_64_99]